MDDIDRQLEAIALQGRVAVESAQTLQEALRVNVGRFKETMKRIDADQAESWDRLMLARRRLERARELGASHQSPFPRIQLSNGGWHG